MPEQARLYDPDDRSHDSARLDALAFLLRQLATSPPRAGATEDPWAHLCAAAGQDGRSYTVELVMPFRAGGAAYYSAHALMDPIWNPEQPLVYDRPETALRAMLDDVIVRHWGPRKPQPSIHPKGDRVKSPVSIGGDERF